MERRGICLWVWLSAAGMFAAEGSAHAAPETNQVEAPPADGGVKRPLSLGVLAGYGQAQDSDGGFGGGTNPYGIGFGFQLSYEFDSHWVLGLGGEYFLGGENRKARDSSGELIRPAPYFRYALAHTLVGYDFRLLKEKGVLRPTLWMGAALGQLRANARHPDGLAPSAYVAPGVSFHYLLGASEWYLGEDLAVSVPIPVGHTEKLRPGLLVLLAAGKRF